MTGEKVGSTSEAARKPARGDRYRIISRGVQIFGYELSLERYHEGSPTPYVFVHCETEWHFPESSVQSVD